jgi:hypothetical protein
MATVDVHNGQSLVAEPDVSAMYFTGVVRSTVLDTGQHLSAQPDIDIADSGDYSTHDRVAPP